MQFWLKMADLPLFADLPGFAIFSTTVDWYKAGSTKVFFKNRVVLIWVIYIKILHQIEEFTIYSCCTILSVCWSEQKSKNWTVFFSWAIKSDFLRLLLAEYLHLAMSRSCDFGSPAGKDLLAFPWIWGQAIYQVQCLPSLPFTPDKQSLNMSSDSSPGTNFFSPDMESLKRERGRPRSETLNSCTYNSPLSNSGVQCTVCRRMFPREKSLQAHMRTHTGKTFSLCILVFLIFSGLTMFYNKFWFFRRKTVSVRFSWVSQVVLSERSAEDAREASHWWKAIRLHVRR